MPKTNTNWCFFFIFSPFVNFKATADMLEEPVSQIRQIYDVIEKSAPDYDAETIYRQLREQEA